MSFAPLPNPTGQQVVAILDAALASHLQVPLVIGTMVEPTQHYVLAQNRRPSGTTVEFNIFDPWTGDTTWVSATDIENGTIPGTMNMVGAIDVPSSVVATQPPSTQRP